MREARQTVSMDAREAVRLSARANMVDWYLAALLAPRGKRDDLVTIAAYLGEVARIPHAVSEPALGDIRLQWWRETIEAGFEGALSGSPVADEMARAAVLLGLPREIVLLPLAGRARELDGGRIPDEGAFGDYITETWGATFRLAVSALGVPESDELRRLCGSAGEAYGRARVALDLPRHAAKGRLPLPLSRTAEASLLSLPAKEAAPAARDVINRLADEARRALAEVRAAAIPCEAYPAFLPLALVEPYLRVLESPRYDPLHELTDIFPLVRIYRLWRARWRGEI